jgi:energy-coupling factor transporter ATP-binding protein EcfA2
MAMIETKYFDSIELLYYEVSKTLNQFVVMPQQGDEIFLKSFIKWKNRSSELLNFENNEILIPADPTSILTFPTLRQEFEITRQLDDNRISHLSIDEIAQQFDFNNSQLDQPIYTLSGGERIRGALVKVNLMLPRLKTIYLCSPSHWLNFDAYYLLDKIVANAIQLDVNVKLFLLDGELWRTDKAKNSTNFDNTKGSTWYLEGNNFSLSLDANAEINTQNRILNFSFESFENKALLSPTLLHGANGAGKSLLAQCICGMHFNEPPVISKSKHGAGATAVRMIIQDSLAHLFRGNIIKHPARVFDFDNEAMKKAQALFKDFSLKCKDKLWTGAPNDAYLIGVDEEPNTLMQAKLMLVAERLVYSPSLLILDEPAWGLSIRQANALASIVINYCNINAIPVLIISHTTNWYDDGFGSQIKVSRNLDNVTVSALI